MKRFLALTVLVAPAVLFAQQSDESVLQWERIVGVFTAPDVDNPNASGTPGPVTTVNGTLVCNVGTSQENIDTTDVTLSARGNARFRGQLDSLPGTCASPLFMVRIGANLPAAVR